ncbi:hypothetical protein SUGI_0363630 [Cryptomeria japonica]|uniref:uncharacterized protein LOC131874976 n=1 Tax=Cryptomeria japonica TaxID=3369 RepID=UPI002408A780|nr:uncharacterized protein LOC131874976 [Cryptomeria japonica]GLJ20052.1 hypothetical protein SUGI_0363630 [Cryptomeria japonica]
MEECGLKVNDKDQNGENILHFVVNSNKNNILPTLLRVKEVQSLIASEDAKGKTPLHKAAANGNTDIMKNLIWGLEANSEGYIRRADLFGQTALHEAASRGHQEAVKYLLQNGSKPLLERNSEGKTALHYSVQLADQKAAIEMGRILLDHYRSGEEKLLLLWAAATGIGTAEQSAESSPEVRSFLKRQSDKEKKAKSSSDLLVSAIKLEYEALAWELINRGANTSQLDNYTKGSLAEDQRKRVKKCMLSSQTILLHPLINLCLLNFLPPFIELCLKF